MIQQINISRIAELFEDYKNLIKEKGWIDVPLTKEELAVLIEIIKKEVSHK